MNNCKKAKMHNLWDCFLKSAFLCTELVEGISGLDALATWHEFVFTSLFTLDHCLRTWSITMKSLWERWCLKPPTSRLFTQLFIQGVDKKKHQSSASLAFVRGIHRWLVNFPHKGPVTRNMFSYDDVIMSTLISVLYLLHSLGPDETYIDGLVQDYTISNSYAMEILQFCTKPLLWGRKLVHHQ